MSQLQDLKDKIDMDFMKLQERIKTDYERNPCDAIFNLHALLESLSFEVKFDVESFMRDQSLNGSSEVNNANEVTQLQKAEYVIRLLTLSSSIMSHFNNIN